MLVVTLNLCAHIYYDIKLEKKIRVAKVIVANPQNFTLGTFKKISYVFWERFF